MQAHFFCSFHGGKFEHCPNTISAQVTDGRTISWQRLAKDTKDDVEDASNDVVTITVCTPVDSLPTTAIGPASALPRASQNSAGPLNLSLTNAGSINTASILSGSACNSSPHTTSVWFASDFSEICLSILPADSIFNRLLMMCKEKHCYQNIPQYRIKL
jgi:hypothetical protein